MSHQTISKRKGIQTERPCAATKLPMPRLLVGETIDFYSLSLSTHRIDSSLVASILDRWVGLIYHDQD